MTHLPIISDNFSFLDCNLLTDDYRPLFILLYLSSISSLFLRKFYTLCFKTDLKFHLPWLLQESLNIPSTQFLDPLYKPTWESTEYSLIGWWLQVKGLKPSCLYRNPGPIAYQHATFTKLLHSVNLNFLLQKMELLITHGGDMRTKWIHANKLILRQSGSCKYSIIVSYYNSHHLSL